MRLPLVADESPSSQKCLATHLPVHRCLRLLMLLLWSRHLVPLQQQNYPTQELQGEQQEAVAHLLRDRATTAEPLSFDLRDKMLQ